MSSLILETVVCAAARILLQTAGVVTAARARRHACNCCGACDATSNAIDRVGHCLRQRFLRFDPRRIGWPNRDRVFLSLEHEPRQSRETLEQLGTLTASPEETLSTSVHCAIAERWMADHYNQPGCKILNFDVYAIFSSRALAQGRARLAPAAAGHFKLGHLCWIYVRPLVPLSEPTRCFHHWGWNVYQAENGAESIAAGLRTFRKWSGETGRPTLIIVNAGETRPAVDLAARSAFPPQEMTRRGRELREAWTARLEIYQRAYPGLAEELERDLEWCNAVTSSPSAAGA
jgi:transketolase